jgi:hypothetical protein
MADFELFPKDQIVGVFRGFREGGLEFHADLVLPYRSDFQSSPMHGQFILVQLETQEEAVLGRICSLSSEGKLSMGSGEEFNIRAVREERPVPEDLREQYLKYRVNIRVLGVVRKKNGNSLTFVPSHRRLPHVGSPVAFLSDSILKEIAGHNIEGASVGHYALGEYIYGKGSTCITQEDWMQLRDPEIITKFPIDNLVSRRSFVFARAGYGKSNLNKLLFSELYRKTPTVKKRNKTDVPVGTIIFDPDGEYFWPDDKGRPGFCDVPHLLNNLVVFTSRKSPSPFYQSFVVGGVRLDVRRLRPSDVIAIALSPDKQDQQNVRKLRGLDQGRWERLVNLIDQNGNQTPLEDICTILDLDMGRQDAEALAARANMTSIIRMLHDRSSLMMDLLIHALKDGKLCVIDVSQMRGSQSLILSGLILRSIFDRNQMEFTNADPQTIPTIAVVEEAQSVLNESATSSEPYIAWVKEGRKYDLGAVLITQQPGSIPVEILSQGDNWFIFHLLSSADLASLKKANAHFSDDLLSTLLNEPIPGQGIFWSSVTGKPYPLSIRALSFEKMYSMLDQNYNMKAINSYASDLRQSFIEVNKKIIEQTVAQVTVDTQVTVDESGNIQNIPGEVEENKTDQNGHEVDILELVEQQAIQHLESLSDIMGKLRSEEGVAWGTLKARLAEAIPPTIDGKDDLAFHFVEKALNKILGVKCWDSFKKGAKGTTYVRAK